MLSIYNNEINQAHTVEITMRKELLLLALHQERFERTNKYILHLQDILNQIATPTNLQLVQNLATNPNFCQGFICYRNSIFNNNGTNLEITTQIYEVSLESRTLLTCTLLQNNGISAYHNQLSIEKDNSYFMQNENLPKLEIEPALQTKSSIPRKATDRDFLAENILLLYKSNNLAIQCLNHQELLIDNTPYTCNNKTLEWFSIPEVIRDQKTNKILSGHNMFRATMLTHSLKNDFQPIDVTNLLIQPFDPTPLDNLITFFKQSDYIQISVFSSLGALAFIVLCCLPCIGALVCKPKCLLTIYNKCAKKIRKSRVIVNTSNENPDNDNDIPLVQAPAPAASAPAEDQQPNNVTQPTERHAFDRVHLEQILALTQQMKRTNAHANTLEIRNRQLEQQLNEQNQLIDVSPYAVARVQPSAPMPNDTEDNNDSYLYSLSQADMILDSRAKASMNLKLAARNKNENQN